MAATFRAAAIVLLLSALLLARCTEAQDPQVILCACEHVTVCSEKNGTCTSDRGCYAIKRSFEDHIERGCQPTAALPRPGSFCSDQDGGVEGYDCCSIGDGDYCNLHLAPSVPTGVPTTDPFNGSGSTVAGSSIGTVHIVAYTILSAVIGLGVVAIVVWCSVFRKRKHPVAAHVSTYQDLQSAMTTNVESGSVCTDVARSTPGSTGTQPCSTEPSTQVSDMYLQGDTLFESSSGMGRPWLVQRTVGRELMWKNKIGAGKFGEVWRCQWRSKDIAVKCSKSRAEFEWRREVQIYESSMVRHNNILGFIAADVCDRDGITQMLIMTEYQRRGSLHSVLESEELTMDAFLRLAVSAADGLLHLHSIFHGSTHVKAGMAHRDIKSKNILVKDNGEACLCDLGLGVIYDPSKIKTAPFEVKRVQVGTRRYMSPEILTGTIDKHSFEAFKSADTYSFSLVLWEIARRCNFLGSQGGAHPYSEPFGGFVGDNPTYEDMIGVAVTQQQRPAIPASWADHHIMKEVGRICRVCWKKCATARLTMSRISKNLTELSVGLDMREEGEDSGCGEESREHETWNKTPPGHQQTQQPQQQEVVTESTLLEPDTPEHSGQPCIVIMPSARAQRSAGSNPAQAQTRVQPRSSNAVYSSRRPHLRYGPTDL